MSSAPELLEPMCGTCRYNQKNNFCTVHHRHVDFADCCNEWSEVFVNHSARVEYFKEEKLNAKPANDATERKEREAEIGIDGEA